MRLLAVDLSNVVTRHWCVAEPFHLPGIDGHAAQGIDGGVRAIVALLRGRGYDHVLVAADAPLTADPDTHVGSARRRALLPEYKATRRRDGDDRVRDLDRRRQIAAAARLLDECGVAVAAVDREEADDVLASASRAYPGDVVILSGDMDVLQLVDERVRVMSPDHPGRLLGTEECARRFGGLLPSQITAYKALAGERGDNIPGVEGFGPKRAAAVIAHYGSLRAVFEDRLMIGVPHALRRRLVEQRDRAVVSGHLARLVDTLELEVEPTPVADVLTRAVAARFRARGYVRIAADITRGA